MPAEEHPDQLLPNDIVIIGTSQQDTLTELLDICDEFFHHANGIVHDELHHFLTRRGYHPRTCLGWFLDLLQLTAHHHRAGTNQPNQDPQVGPNRAGTPTRSTHGGAKSGWNGGATSG